MKLKMKIILCVDVIFFNAKHTALFNSISESFDQFYHLNDTGNVVF